MSPVSRHDPSSPSVRALVSGLFDYAGLFPPASLPFDEAIRKYVRYTSEADRWMIGPFVCPIGKIGVLESFSSLFRSDPPFRVSLLARSVGEGEQFPDAFREDLDAAMALHHRHEGRIQVEMMETKIPVDSSCPSSDVKQILTNIEDILGGHERPPSRVFLEIPRNEDFERNVDLFSGALSTLCVGRAEYTVGLKLRCGGMSSDDFPSTAEVAYFLDSVVETGVLFKATAGLHHPLRHRDVSSGNMMHGFMNVFFAAILRSRHELTLRQLADVLEDTDQDSFEFNDSGIRWRDLHASSSDIQRTRQAIASSIGSCSFDDPRNDLSNLGWLLPT